MVSSTLFSLAFFSYIGVSTLSIWCSVCVVKDYGWAKHEAFFVGFAAAVLTPVTLIVATLVGIMFAVRRGWASFQSLESIREKRIEQEYKKLQEEVDR